MAASLSFPRAFLRVVDTCAGTDDVDGVELSGSDGEHAFELRPRCYIGVLKDGSWVGRVLLEERLGFWTEREVGDENITAAWEEERCEAEVDACKPLAIHD